MGVAEGGQFTKPMTREELRNAAANAAMRRARDDVWCPGEDYNGEDESNDGGAICVEIDPTIQMASTTGSSSSSSSSSNVNDTSVYSVSTKTLKRGGNRKQMVVINLVDSDDDNNDDTNEESINRIKSKKKHRKDIDNNGIEGDVTINCTPSPHTRAQSSDKEVISLLT